MESSFESTGFISLLTTPWFLVVVGGTIVLGIIIAYGFRRSRKRSVAERMRTEAATREVYHKDETGKRI